MGNEQNLLYSEFRERLEAVLLDRYGVDLDDVHVYPLRNWFEHGMTVSRAANVIAEEEGLE